MIIASDRDLLLAQSALQNGVRQSDSLQEGGEREVEVYRVIRALGKYGLLDKLVYLMAPNGLVIDANNGIEEVKPLIPGHVSAIQVTAEDRPQVTRRDDRQNLVTHSRLPGSGTAPDGWTSVTNGTVLDRDVVVSDDPSDSHQAYLSETDDGSAFIEQSVELVEGQKVISACFIEDSQPGQADSGGGVVNLSGDRDFLAWDNRNFNSSGGNIATNGEWSWAAWEITATGAANLQVGVGATGTPSGSLQFSRPFLSDMPVGFDGWDKATQQQWLTDHYAASGTDHQEFAGYRGMRGLAGQEKDLDTTFSFPDNIDEVTFAAFHTAHQGVSTNRFLIFSGARRLWIDTFGRYELDLEEDGGGVVSAALSGANTADFIYAPRLLTGTAKVGGNVKLYVDDELKVTGSSVSSLNFSTANTFRIGFPAGDNLVSLYWGFLYQRELFLDDVINLNAIIRGDLS